MLFWFEELPHLAYTSSCLYLFQVR